MKIRCNGCGMRNVATAAACETLQRRRHGGIGCILLFFSFASRKFTAFKQLWKLTIVDVYVFSFLFILFFIVVVRKSVLVMVIDCYKVRYSQHFLSVCIVKWFVVWAIKNSKDEQFSRKLELRNSSSSCCDAAFFLCNR